MTDKIKLNIEFGKKATITIDNNSIKAKTELGNSVSV